ncbi:MAG: hypothetical protein F9K42_07470 [Ignavibacterium sp.]|nr:MAG: hypothetical protein F9K42_07470 [Ignavibacterium sp.]
MFNYCCRCDSVIYRESAHYNDEGDPYCSDCYESDFDDDCPDNPDVTESDREHVIKLSRSWLQGKIETRRPIFINDKDILLKTIKDKVGLVDNPIYVFGLVDRDEYQLSASSDLFDRVQSYVLLNDLKVIVVSSPGCNRLGISLSLRKNNQQQIIEMIKQITTVQELVTV